jgi:LPPG:FO 2-phospho-L-lactate transferase
VPAIPAAPVVVLAGGSGGAKLARGMLDVAGNDLVVIANTGDDVEIHGAHVSPDPDLVAFWLADRIDARGWGLAGDTFTVMDALRDLGADVWFNLGDRDLAIGIDRARRLAAGERLTEALAALTRSLGVSACVLPASDDPVRTFVTTEERTWPFQEFMIRAGGKAGAVPILDVEFRGAGRATLTPRRPRRSRPRAPSSSGPRTRSSRSARSSPSPACATPSGRRRRRWSRSPRSWAAGP